MFTVSCVEDMRCTPLAAFVYAGDYANDASWRRGVLSMAYEAEGPVAPGVRTREIFRVMGLQTVILAEVTDFTPGRTAFRTVSGPVRCDGSREFCAGPLGTRFTYTLNVRDTGPFRPLEPLISFLLARQLPADLRRLKHRLEANP